ncbi:hypothetical protein PV328_001069 [Microctonus aethiopoides]|uniref:Uncharacterized protein n=1 Tax=Microctonus aethiopoides TaxID=144406 RepID=A0AA39FWS5_9HYME|nr:hypothetical protein PV328_001069 [Microctonus aethiopoides]
MVNVSWRSNSSSEENADSWQEWSWDTPHDNTRHTEQTVNSNDVLPNTANPTDTEPVKRGRGRPRKNPQGEQVTKTTQPANHNYNLRKRKPLIVDDNKIQQHTTPTIQTNKRKHTSSEEIASQARIRRNSSRFKRIKQIDSDSDDESSDTEDIKDRHETKLNSRILYQRNQKRRRNNRKYEIDSEESSTETNIRPTRRPKEDITSTDYSSEVNAKPRTLSYKHTNTADQQTNEQNITKNSKNYRYLTINSPQQNSVNNRTQSPEFPEPPIITLNDNQNHTHIHNNTFQGRMSSSDNETNANNIITTAALIHSEPHDSDISDLEPEHREYRSKRKRNCNKSSNGSVEHAAVTKRTKKNTTPPERPSHDDINEIRVASPLTNEARNLQRQHQTKRTRYQQYNRNFGQYRNEKR